MQEIEMRVCRTCGEDRLSDQFYEGRATCKSCVFAYVRGRYAELTPEEKKAKNRREMLWKSYKLTPEQFDELATDGCAICGTHENLCVDHDHSCCPGKKITCGKCVRGVLCNKHNKGEGAFESIDEIFALLSYRLKFEDVIGEKII